MDSKQIEECAINEIKRYFEMSNKVSTFLFENDKEPLWDGSLYLYRNGGRNNVNLIGRISTQVKGKELKAFKLKNFSYPIGVAALKNYRRDGGVLYFVVQLVQEKRMIFYKELTPLFICKLLKAHGGNKSVNVRFDPFPTELAESENILMQLYHNLKLQGSITIHEPIPIDELKSLNINKLTVSLSSYRKVGNPLLLLTEQPVYIYANITNNGPVVPIADGPFGISMSRSINDDVAIDGRVFFNKYKRTLKDGEIEISVADCLFLRLPTDNSSRIKTQFKFNTANKTLDESILILSFLQSLLNASSISFGNKHLNIAVSDISDGQKEIFSLLERYQAAKETLDQLGVNEVLYLDSLNNDSESLLDLLVAINQKSDVTLDTADLGVKKLVIGNIKVLVLIYLDENSKLSVKSLFDKSLGMKAQYNYKEGKLDESYFLKLSEDDFAELCNIPYDDILQSFTELIGKNPYVYINMNAIGLTILTAYDSLPENSNRKAKMAQVAIDIYDYLYNSGDKQSSTMYYLNKLQVIKRIRPFDDGESATINQILYSNDYDDASKCVAALLSENKSAFMYYWESLNKEHRARIENYPIWKFHSELH